VASERESFGVASLAARIIEAIADRVVLQSGDAFVSAFASRDGDAFRAAARVSSDRTVAGKSCKRDPTVNENTRETEFVRHLLSHFGLYNRAGGGEKGRARWCENTFRRGTAAPSFRRFNCFVLAAFHASARGERERERVRAEASETARKGMI